MIFLVDEMEETMEIEGSYKNSPIIVWLLEILRSWNNEKRSAFLNFATGKNIFIIIIILLLKH